jgi:hypothetical protein
MNLRDLGADFLLTSVFFAEIIISSGREVS